ncbi:MAG: cysteine desulfurase [Clostridiales bacterium]|nr:cysteine desulfurase [Clostridiales bacterium]
MATHYFDNSATTMVSKRAADIAYTLMTESYGNASSLHSLGMEAEKQVTAARQVLAKVLNCRENEIYFTSGGTESDNTAIYGALRLRKRVGRHIITSVAEHPAVLNPVKQLEREGYEVTYLKPDRDGRLSIDAIRDAVRPDTALVTLMLVNNESGVISDISSLRSILRKKSSRALIHSDCVQALFKTSIDVKKLDCDIISLSGHKIHAPKGIGALYVRSGVSLPPYLHGGGQEKGMRSGTEPVPLIAAFGEACREYLEVFEEANERIETFRDKILSRIREELPAAKVNFTEYTIPHIISLSLPGCPSEVTMRILESEGVYVSAGSACSRGRRSSVLTACGLDTGTIDSTVRISMSRYTTAEDCDALVNALKSAYERLHK